MVNCIPYAFQKTVERHAGKIALVYGDHTLTFDELYRLSLQRANVLRECGLSRGDRVGVFVDKSLDQVVTILGIMLANAVLVPILPRLKRDNIEHIVRSSGMKLLITNSSKLAQNPYLKDIATCITEGEDASVLSLAHMLLSSEPVEIFDCIGSDNAAVIFSSGSTGRPKGIVISHRNLLDGVNIVASYLHTDIDERIMGVLPLNFDYGLNQLWQTLVVGCTLVLHEFVFPSDLFRELSRQYVTALPLMPALITRMFDARLYRPDSSLDFSSLRYICSSGGPVNQQMLARLNERFPGVKTYLMYGLTEAFRSTYLPPKFLPKKSDSIGKAIPDVEIYVMDENEQECASGEIGELVHRGGAITKGYWNATEETDRRFREISRFPGEKVVFSGDLVRKDADGFLYFIGRKDSLIKTYGFRVSPTEVEDVANRYNGVKSSVAFGRKNPELGEDIALAYWAAPGTSLNEDEFIRYLRRDLPDYMVPTVIVKFMDFPITGNDGKFDRIQIIEKSKQLLRELDGTSVPLASINNQCLG